MSDFQNLKKKISTEIIQYTKVVLNDNWKEFPPDLTRSVALISAIFLDIQLDICTLIVTQYISNDKSVSEEEKCEYIKELIVKIITEAIPSMLNISNYHLEKIESH